MKFITIFKSDLKKSFFFLKCCCFEIFLEILMFFRLFEQKTIFSKRSNQKQLFLAYDIFGDMDKKRLFPNDLKKQYDVFIEIVILTVFRTKYDFF